MLDAASARTPALPLVPRGTRAALSPEQLGALNSTAPETLVVAAAGSGKTKLLIERLFWALAQSKNGEVVVLTFTERAAEELRTRADARARSLAPGERLHFERRATITTIDGYCGQLVRDDPLNAADIGERLLLRGELEIFLRGHLFEILRTAAPETGWPLSNDELLQGIFDLVSLLRRQRVLDPEAAARALVDDAQRALWRESRHWLAVLNDHVDPRGRVTMPAPGAAHLQAVCDALHGRRLDPAAARAREKLRALLKQALALEVSPHPLRISVLAALLRAARVALERFQAWKRAHHAYDFTDVADAALALLEDPAVRADVVAPISDVLIDEVQDTNVLQERLFAHFSAQARIFRVGDPRQAIYGFRDAEVEGIVDKQRALSADACFELTQNHRSLAPILALANVFWQTMAAGQGTFAPMRAARASDEAAAPALVLFKRDGARAAHRQQLAWLIDFLRDARSAGAAARDTAILCRTSSEVVAVYDALSGAGIEASMRAHRPLGTLACYADAEALLTAFDEPDNDAALFGAMRSGPFGASIDDLLALRHTAAGAPAISALAGTPLSARAEIGKRAFLHALTSHRGRPRHELLLAFLRACHLGDAIVGYAPVVTVLGESEGLGLSLDEALERLRRAVVEAKQGDPDGHPVLTIHAAKGLEWPTVVLPFVCRRFLASRPAAHVLSLPSGAATLRGPWPADGAVSALTAAIKLRAWREEMRLLYVALTRARDRLILLGSEGKKQAGEEASEQSNLVDALRVIYGFDYLFSGATQVARAGASELVITAAAARV